MLSDHPWQVPGPYPKATTPTFPARLLAGGDGMSDQDAPTAARGWWVLNRSRAEHERYVVIGARGLGRLAVEIIGTSWVTRTSRPACVQRHHPAAWASHPRPLCRQARASLARKPGAIHQRHCPMTNTSAWFALLGALGGIVLTGGFTLTAAILNHRWSEQASQRSSR